MTDKFEKWLIFKRVELRKKVSEYPDSVFTQQELRIVIAHLRKYREFLKEFEIEEQREKDEHECKLIDEAGELWGKKRVEAKKNDSL